MKLDLRLLKDPKFLQFLKKKESLRKSFEEQFQKMRDEEGKEEIYDIFGNPLNAETTLLDIYLSRTRKTKLQLQNKVHRL